MTTTQDIDSILNFDPNAVMDAHNQTKERRQFDPKPEQSPSKEYYVRFRILLNPQNPADTVLYVPYYWLNDSQGGFRYESPVALPQPRPCAVCGAYWSLVNKYGKDHPKAKALSWQKRYGAVIQIVSDSVVPDNNGKVFPYRLPVDIYKLVQNNIKLSKEAIDMGKKVKNAMHPINGYDVIMKVTPGENGRSYKGSELAESPTAIVLPNGKRANEVTGEELVAYLKSAFEQTHFYEEFGYKEPDMATLTRVKAVLINQFEQPVDIMPEVPYTNVVAQQQNAPAQQQVDQVVQQQQPLQQQPHADAQPQQAAPPEIVQQPASVVDDIVAAALNGTAN